MAFPEISNGVLRVFSVLSKVNSNFLEDEMHSILGTFLAQERRITVCD